MKRLEFIKYLATHNCIAAGEGGRHTHLVNLTNGKQSVVGRHREPDNNGPQHL